MGYMIWYCYHRIIPCHVWRLGPLMNIIIVIILSLFVYGMYGLWYGMVGTTTIIYQPALNATALPCQAFFWSLSHPGTIVWTVIEGRHPPQKPASTILSLALLK